MSATDARDCLKNLSNKELAQIQNVIVWSPNLAPAERAVAMHLVSEELCTRSVEGIGRKAERFMNRHGDKVAAVAVGAVLGVLGCDIGHHRLG